MSGQAHPTKRRPEPWHGTINGYSNYQCRCGACRAAQAAYMRKWRKKNKAA